MVWREGSFFEAVQHESVLEAEVKMVLQRALEVHLWLGLIAQSESLAVIEGHVARDLDRVYCFDLPIVELFHYMHRGSIIERRMCEGKDKAPAGSKKFWQGSKEGFDICHVEERHIGEGGVERLLTEGEELLLVGCVYDVISN